jgi:hypothetical protein
MPSRQEIRRVRAVLYKDSVLRQLASQASSIDVLMNTDPDIPIAHNDARVQQGTGPNWYYPPNGEAAGQIQESVLDAANRCDRIAEILREIRRELRDVDVNGRDKRHLRKGLAAWAASWEARGRAWRDPGAADIEAKVQEMLDRERESVEELKEVKEYLEVVDVEDVR